MNQGSFAEQNAIRMADLIFEALTKPRVEQQQFYTNCDAHNQPTEPGAATCKHCALDAAERIIVTALNDPYGKRTDITARVLQRTQMWINVGRYSEKNQRQFEKVEDHFHTSKMAVLWPLLLGE